MKLLGRGPRVPVWIMGGALQGAKDAVRRWARTGAAPHFLIEYLNPPSGDFIRARVLSAGDGSEIQVPAPGGESFDRLLEAMKKGDSLFLGHAESVWRLTDVRPETSPSGVPYIAVELTRRKGVSDSDARIRGALETMMKGTVSGEMQPYRREELYGRDPH